MEEIEISSWLTLDAIKDAAKIKETVGDLQSGSWKSIFCMIEDDYLELAYSDTASNFIRRFEDKEEFELALEARKEETGEIRYDEDHSFEEDFEEEISNDESGGENIE